MDLQENIMNQQIRELVRAVVLEGKVSSIGPLLDSLQENQDKRARAVVYAVSNLFSGRQRIEEKVEEEKNIKPGTKRKRKTEEQIAADKDDAQYRTWCYFVERIRGEFWLELQDQSPLELFSSLEKDLRTKKQAKRYEEEGSEEVYEEEESEEDYDE
jgi:hypothetical protein